MLTNDFWQSLSSSELFSTCHANRYTFAGLQASCFPSCGYFVYLCNSRGLRSVSLQQNQS